MKILIIDNFDSFTFNLCQYIGEILTEKVATSEVVVKRNNKITVEEIHQQKFDKIVISPGPGDPSDREYFGVCPEVISEIGKFIPVLGICLGMQGIGHYYGGKVIRAKKPMHGKTSIIFHDGKGVFANLPQNREVMRYHSLVVEKESLPDDLVITAMSQDTKEIMGLRHKTYPIEGIQFHPESIFTKSGKQMLTNFLL